jgi:hypothetical protein
VQETIALPTALERAPGIESIEPPWHVDRHGLGRASIVLDANQQIRLVARSRRPIEDVRQPQRGRVTGQLDHFYVQIDTAVHA